MMDRSPETFERGVEAQLAIGSVTIERRDVELLDAIERTGSIHAAAKELGRSYARTQRRIVELESEAGALTVRRRGGRNGGGTQVTHAGRELRRRFFRFVAQLEGIARSPASVFRGRVLSRAGDMAAVTTSFGTIHARVSGQAECVEVSVRPEAVILARPDGRGPEGTSLRNRVAGRVEWIDRGDATGIVSVALAADDRLQAVITSESLDTLRLEPGEPVVATFKATATRAIPIEGSTD